MFEDDYKAVNDALAPSSEAEQRTLASMRRSMNGAEKKTRGLSVGLRTAVAACLCLLIAAPAVTGVVKLASKRPGRMQAADPTEHAAAPTAETAADYSEVFAWLRSSLSDSADSGKVVLWFEDAIIGDVSYAIPRAEIEVESSTAHSDTNVQVEGVDESDIVKTDGRYIYVLSNDGVAVLTADGAQTHAVSYIPEKEMPRHDEDGGRSFCGMYLAGGRLIVIAQEHKYSPFYYGHLIDDETAPGSGSNDGDDGSESRDAEDCYYCFNWFRGDTMVYVFDIEDPEKPERVSALCMEGRFQDSRLTDGRLYVITSYYPDAEVYPDDPATYVPGSFNNEGECLLTPVSDISRIGEGGNYTYIAALNLAEPSAFSDTLALLGSTDTIYCSGTSMYLAMTRREEEKKPIRFFYDEDDNDCVIDPKGDRKGELVKWYDLTDICRVSLAGGKPVLAAQGSVEGRCLNQFSLDEYDGHLRIAVTKSVSGSIEQQLEDEGVIGYYYPNDNEQENAVYVLNSDLVTVGRIEGLAEDELIKSVRFMGEIGYVVTFRQTDPLFSIDLSVPASPKVLGKLKIPGFSEYLHSWGDGLLFGFGQMADIESGGTQGIKLSMFDIADPTDVKERACLHIENIGYSYAEYDHKAILVAPERGLIGFPAEGDSYVIYSYDEEGFTEKARIALAEPDWFGAKGLYIGSCFYVIDVSGAAYVIDLNTFELSATVEF
ncbi:MAG: beta-propeller domain-containing protein [Clostridia bacterium]|nr:beta-propeller domain-containing protein [Clostridia bacterium]